MHHVKATKGDWLVFGLFVTVFFVSIVLGVYQLQGDAAATSDQPDVAETAEAQAEIETKTNESMTDTQRGQETSPLESTKVQATQAQSDPNRSAETVAQTRERPAQGSTDTDGDGVADARDRCEDTVAGMSVGADGCRLQPLARLEDVLFGVGGAALRPKAKETLTELVSVLENNPDIRVRLEGYTDSVGKESDNEMLSQKRAESVKDYLVSEGIDASRIKTIGMGESNPIATNETEQGRAQNRRVDIMRAKADTMARAGTQGQGTLTARVPMLAMVPVEFQVDPQAKGCWVDMYSKDNFQGDIFKLVGPIDLADMQGPFGHDWKNEIESLKTGPKATIRIYDNENFKEHSEWVGPNKEIENLDGRMELFDSFRSMKVEC